MLEQRLQQQFFDSADLNYATAEAMSRPMADAVQAMVGCITAGGKLLCCGAGPWALLARHAADVLVGQFERVRPGLAALALSGSRVAGTSTVEAGEIGGSSPLARQIQALGQPGDVLLALGAQGEAARMVDAINAAHAREMTVIAMTGGSAATPAVRDRLAETDVLIAVAHERVPRVLEAHLLVLHCLCDAVDLQLLGEQDFS